MKTEFDLRTAQCKALELDLIAFDAVDEDRRSFLESVIAASTPVHWPFTPAQVTLTTDAPPLDDDVICKLCGLCVR